MSKYNVAFVTIAAVLLCTSAFVAALPVINCDPNSVAEAPTNIQKLCYSVLEMLRNDPAQENASDLITSRLTERGIKRQDVDHVFLRFGKRFGF